MVRFLVTVTFAVVKFFFVVAQSSGCTKDITIHDTAEAVSD